MTVSILVCDRDELARRAWGRVIAERGYEVVGEATTAVEAVQLREVFGASVVVLGNELLGLSGIDVVAELADAGVRVILVSNDLGVLDQARAAGAFFAVARGDLDMLERALDALGDTKVEGDRRSGIDRRATADRRQTQDWGKVIRERRDGSDRRAGERRALAADAGDPTNAVSA
jgi:chemotaxis response regulator CheB